MIQTLKLIKPDDWHVHLRDGDALPSLLPDLAKRFGRAIVMPNLKPPVVTVEQARAYRRRILSALPSGSNFEPLMTLYLTEATTSAELRKARDSGIVYGVKLYPAGATTNSDAGVRRIEHVYPALETMQEIGLPLLVHGEVVDPDIDIFDRERVFIETQLAPALERYPGLRCVLEHITTDDAVAFVRSRPRNLGATITAHHLLYNRNALLAGGVRPHFYCLPVLKREPHRLSLLHAAASGDARFFLGTDSAPHSLEAKQSACGCAGIYTGHAALELYAEAFDSISALDKLERFTSLNGPAFYGLPANEARITLAKTAWIVPASYPLGRHELIPLRAGEKIGWQIAG